MTDGLSTAVQEIGESNAKALGRVEATLVLHGDILVEIKAEAKETNSRVTHGERDLELVVDRANQLAVARAARGKFWAGLIIAAVGASGGALLLVLLKVLGA